MDERTAAWLRLSEMELRMAGAGLERDAEPLCVYHCQQAVEKLLKAIWSARLAMEPPRTHNLPVLVAELRLPLAEWSEFLRDLSIQGQAARYPYSQPYTTAEASNYLERTLELCRELRRLLT